MTKDAHVTPDELLEYLGELGIAHTTARHAPVFTVEEAKRLRGTLRGGNCKSLFLKNKKGVMWLVVVPEDQRVDLDALAESLESKRLSFGSPERLMRYLGVVPGAVTPLAAVNDRDGVVTVVVARELLAHAQLNFHPLVNNRTTTISSPDFLRFLDATGHRPLLLDTEHV